MATQNRNQKDNGTEKVLVGAGLAAMAAGVYFFLGPDGKKHQKKMRGWMVKMKGEVLEKIEDAKEVTQPIYNDIVDTVAQANKVAGKIPQGDIAALATDLKKQWKNMQKLMTGKKPTSRRGSAASVKRSTAKRKAKSNKTK